MPEKFISIVETVGVALGTSAFRANPVKIALAEFFLHF